MLPQSARTGPGPGKPRKTRLLVIVQNLPVPFDRRVWLECQALTSAGYQVSVVCPQGRDEPSYEVIDSVQVHYTELGFPHLQTISVGPYWFRSPDTCPRPRLVP